MTTKKSQNVAEKKIIVNETIIQVWDIHSQYRINTMSYGWLQNDYKKSQNVAINIKQVFHPCNEAI